MFSVTNDHKRPSYGYQKTFLKSVYKARCSYKTVLIKNKRVIFLDMQWVFFNGEYVDLWLDFRE